MNIQPRAEVVRAPDPFRIVLYEKMIVPRFWKTRTFVLSEKGRWGPRWLHRLMLRICTNLGMIQHEKDSAVEEKVNSYVIAPMDAFVYAREAIELWREREGEFQSCEVIMGQSFHKEMMRSDVLHQQIRFDLTIGFGRNELCGVPFRIVPHFEGCAVIPLRRQT
jgi:hypothetical protein